LFQTSFGPNLSAESDIMRIGMAKKKVSPRKNDRRNLGLRATSDELERLKKIAKDRGMSLQGIFNLFKADLLSGGSSIESRFLKAIPASAVIKNRDLKIVWVNDGYAAVAGSKESLIGKSIGEIFATALSAEKIEAADRKIFKEKHATISVETVLNKWGKNLQRLRFRFPIPGPGGQVEYLGAIGFDIDEVVDEIKAEIRQALTRLASKEEKQRDR